MKLKSLILGSVAAAGLSTAGFAADLGVLTSLDVCDELGLSGLTMSSDTNCLQISGEVKYEFKFGDYNAKRAIATTQFGVRNVDVPGTSAGAPAQQGTFAIRNAAGAIVGTTNLVAAPTQAQADAIGGPGSTSVQVIAPVAAVSPASSDWESKVEAYLKFVGTAGSDFGPASVVVTVKEVQHSIGTNGVAAFGGDNKAVNFDEAYVQVGDTTVLSAGKRGSIFNKGDDEPFNFTKLFISDAVDAGVADKPTGMKTGGHVIQLWSNIGEGLIAKIGLENLNPGAADSATAGTLVGVLDYSGSGITAHISGAVGGLLDGVQNETYAVHTGFTGTFDQFKLRAAFGAGGAYAAAGNSAYWNGLVSGEAKFDMFTIALSGEVSGGNAAGGADLGTDYGFGGSIGATVAEGVAINLGGRYFNDGTAGVPDGYQVAAQLVASLSESVKLTTEVGVYGTTELAPVVAYSDFYGKAELGWTPVGGGFSSTVGATVQQNGAYKVSFTAKKTFQ